ncbi:hypothetical protein B9Z55_004556 [Caenorhabditis nigoni]|nr:hypothetical protein B9Z55_004556 [Caenorhabditis nigoni]
MSGTMPVWTGPCSNGRDHAGMNGTMAELAGPCPNEQDHGQMNRKHIILIDFQCIVVSLLLSDCLAQKRWKLLGILRGIESRQTFKKRVLNFVILIHWPVLVFFLLEDSYKYRKIQQIKSVQKSDLNVLAVQNENFL